MVDEIKKDKTKYVFVVGGVMSGVGKGVTTSSIATILQAKGYNVSAIKIDPYINVDAGTILLSTARSLSLRTVTRPIRTLATTNVSSTRISIERTT